MPGYENTLLDLSCKAAVTRQIEYGRQLDVPWGMSESGYNLRDSRSELSVSRLRRAGAWLQTWPAEDIVITPYATTMALMVSPRESCRNSPKPPRAGRRSPLRILRSN
jgi:hypothetical protein